MGILSKLFGLGPKADIGKLIQEGAVVVDVRTKAEYQQGNIKGSLNIPLDQLDKGMSKIPRNKTVITVCASGMRSAAAKGKLRAAGYNVENGGSWLNLRKYSL